MTKRVGEGGGGLRGEGVMGLRGNQNRPVIFVKKLPNQLGLSCNWF